MDAASGFPQNESNLSGLLLCSVTDTGAQALDAIRNGMKIKEASRFYGVPPGTIQDRLHLRVPEGPRKMGPDYILSLKLKKLAHSSCSLQIST